MKNVFFTDRESVNGIIEIFRKQKVRFKYDKETKRWFPIEFETSNRGWKIIQKSELSEKVWELPF